MSLFNTRQGPRGDAKGAAESAAARMQRLKAVRQSMGDAKRPVRNGPGDEAEAKTEPQAANSAPAVTTPRRADGSEETWDRPAADDGPLVLSGDALVDAQDSDSARPAEDDFEASARAAFAAEEAYFAALDAPSEPKRPSPRPDFSRMAGDAADDDDPEQDVPAVAEKDAFDKLAEVVRARKAAAADPNAAQEVTSLSPVRKSRAWMQEEPVVDEADAPAEDADADLAALEADAAFEEDEAEDLTGEVFDDLPEARADDGSDDASDEMAEDLEAVAFADEDFGDEDFGDGDFEDGEYFAEPGFALGPKPAVTSANAPGKASEPEAVTEAAEAVAEDDPDQDLAAAADAQPDVSADDDFEDFEEGFDDDYEDAEDALGAAEVPAAAFAHSAYQPPEPEPANDLPAAQNDEPEEDDTQTEEAVLARLKAQFVSARGPAASAGPETSVPAAALRTDGAERHAPGEDFAMPGLTPAFPEDPPPPPSMPHAGRGRRGRNTTRLLGFDHAATAKTDLFEAPQDETPAQEDAEAGSGGRFPVGWLVVIEGPGIGHAFTLYGGLSQIGRGEGQRIRLDFGDNAISRENHAAVAYDDEDHSLTIAQNGKANLVRLNGKPVLSHELLADGDIIKIGTTKLRVVQLCNSAFNWEGVSEGNGA